MKAKLCATVALVLAQLAGLNRAHAGGLVAAWGDQTILPIGVNNVKAISAGYAHALALRADGSVVAWWADTYAQGVPPGLSNVVAISAGGGLLYGWNLAVKADGHVVAWDADDLNESDYWHASCLSNITAIAAGWYHWVALKSDGTLVSWGVPNYSSGLTNIPVGLSNVKAIAAGLDFNLVLTSDGTVTAWGQDQFGNTNVPSGLSNVVAIAAGPTSVHCLAIRADGTVVAWGDNSSGQCDVPAGLSNVVAVAAAWRQSVALKNDGTVVAWGAYAGGSTGQGKSTLPESLSNVSAISVGEDFGLAIVPDGPVQITRDLQPSSQPLILHSNLTFSVSAAGAGPLSYRWYLNGQEWFGQALTNNSRVSGANTAALTIRDLQNTDIGTYTVIVSNAFGSVVSSASTLTGPPVITGQSWTNLTVGAGAYISLFASDEGTPPLAYLLQFNGTNLLESWTDSSFTRTSYFYFDNVQPSNSGVYSLVISNLYGYTQADFSLVVTDRPPYIVTQPGGTSVPLGGKAAFAVSARGSLPLKYQWRFNGQDISDATNATLTLTNLGYNQTGYYDVVVSNPFGVVVTEKVWLRVGQTSVQVWSLSARYAPMNVPPGLTNAVAIAAGSHQVLVLKGDGTVAAWSGAVPFVHEPAVTNIPTGLNDVTAIAAGSYNNLDSSMALRADGSVVVWTEVSYGPFWVTNLPVPATATNVVAIADGGDHYLALRYDGTVVASGTEC